MTLLRGLMSAAVGLLLVSAVWSLLRAPAPAPLPSLRIEVQNGCGVAGLAADKARGLTRLGLDVVRVADAEHQRFARSVLVDRRGKLGLTRRWAERIGPVIVVQERRVGSDVDCVLVLGADHEALRLGSTAGSRLDR